MHSLPETSVRLDERAGRKEMFRRLLVEASVAAGYLLRLERRERSGRIMTRIIQPVAYLAADGASEAGTVFTRLADRTESTFPLGEVDHVSIASDHLPAEQVSRHGWTVGDPVRHAEFGFGVMQSFPAGDDVAAVVRFARCGEAALSPSTAPLERLRLTASGSGPECYWSRVQPGD
jgi:hypothetical protein